MSLVASNEIYAETLVWAEGMDGWTAWVDAKQLFQGGAAVSDAQISDIMAILDKDGALPSLFGECFCDCSATDFSPF